MRLFGQREQTEFFKKVCYVLGRFSRLLHLVRNSVANNYQIYIYINYI